MPKDRRLPLRVMARLVAAVLVLVALWYGAGWIRDAIFSTRSGSFKAKDALAPIAFVAGVLVLWALARAVIAMAAGGFRIPREISDAQRAKLGMDKRDALVMGAVALAFAVLGAVGLYLYETGLTQHKNEQTVRPFLVLTGVGGMAALVLGLFALIRAGPPVWYGIILRLRPCFTWRRFGLHVLAVAVIFVAAFLMLNRLGLNVAYCPWYAAIICCFWVVALTPFFYLRRK